MYPTHTTLTVDSNPSNIDGARVVEALEIEFPDAQVAVSHDEPAFDITITGNTLFENEDEIKGRVSEIIEAAYPEHEVFVEVG